LDFEVGKSTEKVLREEGKGLIGFSIAIGMVDWFVRQKRGHMQVRWHFEWF
jgi:hypothetical protein